MARVVLATGIMTSTRELEWEVNRVTAPYE